MKKRWIAVLAVLLLLLAVFAALNAAIGSVSVSPADALRPGTIGHDILWKVRLPRLAAGAVLGGALALSGFLLQAFFANPIAGPFVLGISSGAKLCVALVMIFLLGRGIATNSAVLIGAAFVGALASMGVVLLLARRVKRASVLIISGVMIGYICSAITDFVVTFANDESIVNLHHWSQGSFSGTSWEQVRVMAAVVLAASVAVIFLSKSISAFQLGEAYAQSVGVHVRGFRVLLVLLSSLLCACVTAFAGPVSFIGVAVPHLVRSLAKTTKPLIVIPLCFLGGAVFCLGCDLLARTMFAPVEMSISSVSALFGAPVVIWIMAGKAARN